MTKVERRKRAADDLIMAAVRWVKLAGGTAILAGPIGILDEEHPFIAGSRFKFQVCVKMLGRKPERATKVGNDGSSPSGASRPSTVGAHKREIRVRVPSRKTGAMAARPPKDSRLPASGKLKKKG